MRLYRIHLAVVVVFWTALACQALTGGPGNPPTSPSSNENITPESSDNESAPNTDFPMTPDAYNVTEAGGSLIFYTKLSLQEALQFYRDEYTSKGYTERESVTVVSENTFNIVFDGDPSGQAVVIQSVDLGDGSRTISIRLEDI
jgi:hypothetical protein